MDDCCLYVTKTASKSPLLHLQSQRRLHRTGYHDSVRDMEAYEAHAEEHDDAQPLNFKTGSRLLFKVPSVNSSFAVVNPENLSLRLS